MSDEKKEFGKKLQAILEQAQSREQLAGQKAGAENLEAQNKTLVQGGLQESLKKMLSGSALTRQDSSLLANKGGFKEFAPSVPGSKVKKEKPTLTELLSELGEIRNEQSWDIQEDTEGNRFIMNEGVKTPLSPDQAKELESDNSFLNTQKDVAFSEFEDQIKKLGYEPDWAAIEKEYPNLRNGTIIKDENKLQWERVGIGKWKLVLGK